MVARSMINRSAGFAISPPCIATEIGGRCPTEKGLPSTLAHSRAPLQNRVIFSCGSFLCGWFGDGRRFFHGRRRVWMGGFLAFRPVPAWVRGWLGLDVLGQELEPLVEAVVVEIDQ